MGRRRIGRVENKENMALGINIIFGRGPGTIRPRDHENTWTPPGK